MQEHPLVEVFGFPADNLSPEAARYRKLRLCPFNNKVPNCTKDKANDPLGVCSIFERDGEHAITCPIRFRQDWLIAEDAAAFFFPENTNWTALAEVRLSDKHGQSAGNIDVILVAYDERGQVLDFGSLEVQAVYISGNVRRPFEHYMQDPMAHHKMDWSNQPNYPRPDYLSSSRKRLVPQLIYKGGILKAWGKKQAVALHRKFFETLPELTEVEPTQADMVWMIYDLALDELSNRYQLIRDQLVFTQFKPALDRISISEPGPIETFIERLQDKLDIHLDGEQNPPDAPTLDQLM